MKSCETNFLRIFQDGRNLDLLELSDAKLRTDDGCVFDIHKATLARSSDYFRRMFCDTGKKRRKFKITGINGECLSVILVYVYTGKIGVTERNVEDLILWADFLLLGDITMKINREIELYITEGNCLKVLRAVAMTLNEYVFKKSLRFIQTRFEGVIRCQKDDLEDYPEDILRWFLRDRRLYVYNETTVWQAIVAWTQKDIPLRMSYVPKLLLTLAIEDVGEELAMEILQHEIISKNSFMKDLLEIPSSNDSIINPDVLFTFLRSYSNCFMEQNQNHSHRIPTQLLVILSENNLYITYDENTDLCRKITKVSCEPDIMIAIGHNIYIFEMAEYIFINFDLSTMNWVRTETFRNDYFDEFCIVATDSYIYVLGEFVDEEDIHLDVEVYDTANNRWFNGVPLRHIFNVSAVGIEKKVYVVGHTVNFDGMTTHMFDPDTQQWSILSPPTVYRSTFALVAYHQKIYLIGESDAEVYDPAINLWKELPNLPYTDMHESPKAIVFFDVIFVCHSIYGYDVFWDNEKECWKVIPKNGYFGEFPEKDTLNDLYFNSFCIVDDVETIRMITKQNRSPGTQMRKIDFS